MVLVHILDFLHTPKHRQVFKGEKVGWEGGFEKPKMGWVTTVREVLAHHWLCQWLRGVVMRTSEPLSSKGLPACCLSNLSCEEYTQAHGKEWLGLGAAEGYSSIFGSPHRHWVISWTVFLAVVVRVSSTWAIALVLFTGSSLQPSDVM